MKIYYIAFMFITFHVNAANEVSFKEDGNYRYIKSNGMPNHTTGKFPNSGNPNSISEQNHNFRVTLTPKNKGRATPVQLPGGS